jgi:hypothetical protein
MASMRALVVVATFLGAAAASAGPVARGGMIGGYDTSAPGHKEDGLALGVGYRFGWLTTELDYAYMEYDDTTGFGGGANHAGLLLQAQLFSAPRRLGYTRPHFDFDLGAGWRWLHWQPESPGINGFKYSERPTARHGRELVAGLSANFGVRLALHFVLFQPEVGPPISCRGSCPMQVSGDELGVLFEASFVVGDVTR